MLSVGDLIEIRGQEAIVCFETKYNNENYICVAMNEDNPVYEIYKYKIEDDRLMVAHLTTDEEVAPIIKIFVEEEINQNGLPEELQRIFDSIEAE